MFYVRSTYGLTLYRIRCKYRYIGVLVALMEDKTCLPTTSTCTWYQVLVPYIPRHPALDFVHNHIVREHGRRTADNALLGLAASAHYCHRVIDAVAATLEEGKLFQ